MMIRYTNLWLSLLIFAMVGTGVGIAARAAADDDQEISASEETEDYELLPDVALDVPYIDDSVADACCDPSLPFGTLFDPPTSGYPGHERIHRAVLLGRLWMRGEYLAWSMSKTRLPPLLAGSELAPDDNGDVDLQLLYGDFDAHDALRSGGRFRAGLWFTPDQISGVEASFLGIDDQDIRFLVTDEDLPVIARPFVNAQTGQDDAVFVYYPELVSGVSWIQSDVETLAAEVILRHMINCRETSRFDVIAGYRYLRLLDRLSIDDGSVAFEDAGDSQVTTVVLSGDLFQSENEFHGADIGLIGRWWNYRWALETLGRVALGQTSTTTDVFGLTFVERTTVANNTQTTEQTEQAGGVLALPSNMGNHSQSEFSAVAEFGVRLEYALSRQCRATLGYTLIWWSSVARAVDSVDVMVDTSQIPPEIDPTAVRPEFKFHNDDFWMQGLSVGLQYDF